VPPQCRRAATASPGRAGGAIQARCENEEGKPSSTVLLSVGTPTQCADPAGRDRAAEELGRVRAGGAGTAAAVGCSGGETQPSLPGSVELAAHLGGSPGLAESAGRRDHDQVSRCSAPLQVRLLQRRLTRSPPRKQMRARVGTHMCLAVCRGLIAHRALCSLSCWRRQSASAPPTRRCVSCSSHVRPSQGLQPRQRRLRPKCVQCASVSPAAAQRFTRARA
jgi:hypothetical protein